MDSIKIKGLEVFARHGVFKEENVLGQKFIVNAELRLDVRAAGLTDDLDKTVDYGMVCRFITDYLQENTYQLLETAAELLAGELLRRLHGVMEVRLEIKKPWAPVGLPLESVSVTVERKWHTAYIAIGSNLGDRQGYLDMAADEIEADANCFLAEIADTIETAPYGMTDQPDFLNSCMKVRTLYTPFELLRRCNDIEEHAGRKRDIHWGPRTLDMDIIFYDDEIISEEKLVIPHMEMHKRAFVLIPLAQLAPYKLHPVLKKRVIELLSDPGVF